MGRNFNFKKFIDDNATDEVRQELAENQVNDIIQTLQNATVSGDCPLLSMLRRLGEPFTMALLKAILFDKTYDGKEDKPMEGLRGMLDRLDAMHKVMEGAQMEEGSNGDAK